MKNTVLILLFFIYNLSNAQIVNIPDSNFKNALLGAYSGNYVAKDMNGDYTTIDVNFDNEIQISEAENISYINVYQNNIYDLTGIEDFVNLEYLHCKRNYLSNLDISNNTNLSIMVCANNQLTTLDVSNNTNLTVIDCSENQLTTLDVNNNTNLTSLNFSKNQFTSLNIANNTTLTDLFCSENQLTTLDLANNINLSYLSCGKNQLTTLDLANNIDLTDLSCNNNLLTTLDLSNNANLEFMLFCYGNQLTTLDISNTNVTQLYCSENQLTNIISNNYLTHLHCKDNQLTNLDISNINLSSLNCSNNQLIDLDVSNSINLEFLDCRNNQLSSLNVINNTNLTDLECTNNQLTTLDVSNNNLSYLYCDNNTNLSYLNLKNGYNDNLIISGDYASNFQNLPNLQTVCVDELNTDLTAFITTETGLAITFTEYCSFEPAQSNSINGTVNIDLDNNGCDINDISLNNVLLTANNGTESFGTFVLVDASYSMFTNEGDFTTAVTTNLPNYWSASPSSYTNVFTGFDNSFTANFCITPNQTINDVNITIIPTILNGPGFDTNYKIVYRNVGTTILNGTVSLDYDETMLDFLNASEVVNSQTSNNLTFDYNNLNPFETRTINVLFNVFAPPTVNVGEILHFTASINPISSDYTPDDNIFNLDQVVLGSFDPNDITCSQGIEIAETDIDKYLHYVIRFQNEGTASAINIVVKNILDNKLDWNTLQLEASSHQNRVVIKNGNEIEFIFENIQLPDNTTDEAGSHGYIAYKIKPKPAVVLGDIIPNKADIFFDYNEAVPTNTANVEVVSALTTSESNLLNFNVYPTPTNNILNIRSKTAISSIEIYNELGQLILKNINKTIIDISSLSQGVYLCKIIGVNGHFSISKVVRK